MIPKYVEYLILAVLVLANAILIGMKIIEKRSLKNRDDPPDQSSGVTPGQSSICINHDRAIVELQTCVKFLKEQIPEIKTSMEKNFNKVYDLLRNRK